MANEPPKGKGKKRGTTFWVVVGVGGLLAAYVLYKYYANSSTTSTSTGTSTAPTTSAGTSDTTGSTTGTSTDNGLAGSAGGPTDTGATTSDYLSALGTQNQSLISAFTAQEQDLAGLAQAQIANVQTQTALSSTNTQTVPTVGTQPGGANSPIVVQFTSPSVTTAAQKSTVSKSSSTPAHYYTYKSQVPLLSGQTLHFQKGKGYYAA